MATTRAYHVLGPLDVLVAGRAVSVGGQRRRSLLTRLLLAPNRVVPADRLIEDLWGEDSTPSTANTLQVGISALRSALEPDRERRATEPVLTHEAGGYVLHVADGQLDVHRFEELLADGRRLLGLGEPDRAEAQLQAAIDLFRGQPLQDLAGQPCAEPEIVRLNEEREAAVEDRSDALLAAGRHAEIVPELERLADAAPFRERRWSQLMLGLYRCGRQTDALRAYERVRTILREELGVDPSPLLRDLEQAMLEQRPELEVRARASVASPSGTMTIVITDIAGSTALAARVGDVEYERLRSRHLEDVHRVTESCGGHVVNNHGDGSLLRFASASAAVQAAIDIQRVTAAGGLSVKIGMDAGEPVETTDHDVVGTPVNRAARLADVADGGSILASSTVRALVESRGDLHFGSSRSLELKGLDGPQEAHAVRWSADGHSPMRHPAALVATDLFIGRDEAQAALRGAWRRAAQGEGGVCLVRGEPGAGKTRLLAELSRDVASSGGMVLYGRCERDGGSYRPFNEALTRFITQISDTELRRLVGTLGSEIAAIVPSIADRVPVTAMLEGDPGLRRMRLHAAVAEVIARIAEIAPVLVVLDDLQWADRVTMQLLGNVAGEPGPVLFGLTYRDTEVDRGSPVSTIVRDLQPRMLVDPIDLAGLGPDEVGACVQARAGRSCADEVARLVHGRTGGNPLLVEELTHRLVLEDALDDPSRASADDTVPATMGSLVEQRLEALTEDEIEVATAASVLGPEFDWEVVPPVSQQDEGAVLDALDRLVATRILAEVRGTSGRYTFVHDLVRQALHDRLGAARRQAFHRRAADALEATGLGRPADVAGHRVAGMTAATLEETVEAAVRAADDARAHVAHDDAVRWYAQAIDLVGEEADPARLSELKIGWADALTLAGEVNQAREGYRTAADLAERAGDAELLGRAAVGLSGNTVGGHARWGLVDEEARAVLDRADLALGPVPSAQRVTLLAARAALLVAVDPPEADRWSAAALELAETLGDPGAERIALRGRRMAIWRPDTLEDRIALDHRLLELAGDERPDDRFDGLMFLLTDVMEAGRTDEADAAADRMEAIAEALDWPLARWNVLRYRAMRLAMQGRLDDAVALGERAMKVGRTVSPANAVGSFGALMAGIQLLRDEVEGLGDAILALAEGQPGLSPHSALVPCYWYEEGRTDDARDLLAELGTRLDEIVRGPDWLTTVTSLSLAANLVGDTELAAALVPVLAPYADRHVVMGATVFSLGPTERYLGLLADAVGDLDAADAHFSRAAERCDQLGVPMWGALTRTEHGSCLQRHGHDADRATALLDTAGRVAEEVPLPIVRRKVAAAREQR